MDSSHTPHKRSSPCRARLAGTGNVAPWPGPPDFILWLGPRQALQADEALPVLQHWQDIPALAFDWGGNMAAVPQIPLNELEPRGFPGGLALGATLQDAGLLAEEVPKGVQREGSYARSAAARPAGSYLARNVTGLPTPPTVTSASGPGA